MTLFQRVESLEAATAALRADVDALKSAPTVDAQAIADLSAKVDALRADVGEPTVAAPTAA